MENGTGLGDEVCEGDSPLEGVGTVSPIGEFTIQFIERCQDLHSDLTRDPGFLVTIHATD